MPDATDQSALVRAARRRAAAAVLLHGGALAAGLGAEVGRDAARWFGVRGPHCPLGAGLGEHACPGCGLVRSFAAAAQGDLPLAVAMHPAGPVLVLLAALGLLLGLGALRRGRLPPWLEALRAPGRGVFTASILGGWLLRLATTSG